jgi:hypothetical protein
MGDCAVRGVTLLLALLAGLAGAFAAQANGAVYWANGSAIGRMNLDGTNPSPGFVSDISNPISSPCGLAVDGSHIYWADKFRNRIGRAELEGTNKEYEFITGADEPCGVAVDAGHVYWANYDGNSIGRADLDGTEVNQEFVPAVTKPCGVAVNEDFIFWTGGSSHGYVGRAERLGGARGPNLVEFEPPLDYDLCGVAANQLHVFWGGFGDSIGRVGVDGSDPEPSFIAGAQSPCSITIGDGRLYFGEVSQWWNGLGHISRANLDGTGLERELATGLNYPCGIAADSLAFGPSYVAPPPLPSWTPCAIDQVRVSKWNGGALVRVNGPTHGETLDREQRTTRPPAVEAAPAECGGAGRVALVDTNLAGWLGAGGAPAAQAARPRRSSATEAPRRLRPAGLRRKPQRPAARPAQARLTG